LALGTKEPAKFLALSSWTLRLGFGVRRTIRIIAEALAMNPALRFITSQRFLGFFSSFGLLCSLAVFAQHVLR